MTILNRIVESFALPIVLAATCSTVGFAQVNPETGSVRDRIGYTALAAELGTDLPDGSSTSVAIVEAFNGGSANYLPSASFLSKTINDRGLPPDGETAGESGHATGSAQNFFGSTSSSPATDLSLIHI